MRGRVRGRDVGGASRKRALAWLGWPGGLTGPEFRVFGQKCGGEAVPLLEMVRLRRERSCMHTAGVEMAIAGPAHLWYYMSKTGLVECPSAFIDRLSSDSH